MGMNDKDGKDVNMMREFRGEHRDLWREFVKDDDDYCNKCSNMLEYCYCEAEVYVADEELNKQTPDKEVNYFVDYVENGKICMETFEFEEDAKKFAEKFNKKKQED